MWPHVCHLLLVGNLITNISSTDVLTSLELLDLSENSIESWDEVHNLGSLPKYGKKYFLAVLWQCGIINMVNFLEAASITICG